MKRQITEARGMTLPEILVYAALSVVVLNLCTVTFIQSTRFSTAATQRALHQQALAQFSRDVTRAVHGASRVLEGAGDTVTSDQQVVLDTPDGIVVIGMAGVSPAIWGLAQEGDAWRLTRVKRYAAGARTMQIAFDTPIASEARRLTFHITGPPRKEPDDTANNRTIVATLRVDGASP